MNRELLELREHMKNAYRERDEAVEQSTNLQTCVTELTQEIQSVKMVTFDYLNIMYYCQFQGDHNPGKSGKVR